MKYFSLHRVHIMISNCWFMYMFPNMWALLTSRSWTIMSALTSHFAFTLFLLSICDVGGGWQLWEKTDDNQWWWLVMTGQHYWSSWLLSSKAQQARADWWNMEVASPPLHLTPCSSAQPVRVTNEMWSEPCTPACPSLPLFVASKPRGGPLWIPMSPWSKKMLIQNPADDTGPF